MGKSACYQLLLNFMNFAQSVEIFLTLLVNLIFYQCIVTVYFIILKYPPSDCIRSYVYMLYKYIILFVIGGTIYVILFLGIVKDFLYERIFIYYSNFKQIYWKGEQLKCK